MTTRKAPDPTPLLRPRSVAIVGASEREGSYGENILRNIAVAGFEGDVWGVNPRHDRVHGRPCVANVGELPEPVDAVVVAIPAPRVGAVLSEAIERGCGGAIVLSSGFGEVEAGAELERELAAIAEGGLPVCGPNCNGVVSVPARSPLWGDSVERQLQEGGVALISQSGNLAVNALGMRRGIGFHTVVSTGNQAVISAADWIEAVSDLDGVRSIALFLEEDGDGADLSRALAGCAEREIGVAVLKVGSSEAGARAAGAHTGAVAGDQRVFSALLEEAGAAIARDPQELLELARCLAHAPRGRPSVDGGLAVLTCSGGDSGLAADLAEREGLPLPELAPETSETLTGLLPEAATVGNPLDYTSMLWDRPEVLEQVTEAVGSDPGVGQLLLLFDEPDGLSDSAKAGWDIVRRALIAGAERGRADPLLASTVPDLLPERSALGLAERGIAAMAGLSEAIRCVKALRAPRPLAQRLLAISAAAAARPRGGGNGEWLGEAESKRLLANAGIAVPRFGTAAAADAAVSLAAELGGPVAIKLSSPGLLHKSEAGALELGLEGDDEVCAAAERLLALPTAAGDATLLVEEMAIGEVELLIAARRDGVVPALAIGLGGIWAEALDDVAIVPLPASPELVEAALRGLRAAPLLTGARGGKQLDIGAAAALGSRLGAILLEEGLDLIEVNPAQLGVEGCVAVDALARRG